MYQPITLNTKDNRFLISIDKEFIDKKFLLNLMNHIRLEYLAKKVDFDESIEVLAEEIKDTWWNENKKRLLNPEL